MLLKARFNMYKVEQGKCFFEVPANAVADIKRVDDAMQGDDPNVLNKALEDFQKKYGRSYGSYLHNLSDDEALIVASDHGYDLDEDSVEFDTDDDSWRLKWYQDDGSPVT